MHITEKEIYSEFDSIRQSLLLVQDNKHQIERVFKKKRCCWFIGSGSSFLIGKSAAKLIHMRSGMPAFSVAAGDLMLHFEKYRDLFKDSIAVFLSRSGNTTEGLFAIDLIKKNTNAQCISICAKDSSDLIDKCDFNIRIPWAFDESVCQTKTVGSIYASIAMIAAIVNKDTRLISALLSLVDNETTFREQMVPEMKRIAALPWNNAVVLADSEVSGLMEEGSLAFKEICQLPSNFYNVLDVRHGPIVMIDNKTLVAVYIEVFNDHIKKLISDICAKGAYCVSMGAFAEETGSSYHLQLPVAGDPAAECLYALYALQMLTYQKALILGVNPDKPDGLNPWIAL